MSSQLLFFNRVSRSFTAFWRNPTSAWQQSSKDNHAPRSLTLLRKHTFRRTKLKSLEFGQREARFQVGVLQKVFCLQAKVRFLWLPTCRMPQLVSDSRAALCLRYHRQRSWSRSCTDSPASSAWGGCMSFLSHSRAGSVAWSVIKTCSGW